MDVASVVKPSSEIRPVDRLELLERSLGRLGRVSPAA